MYEYARRLRPVHLNGTVFGVNSGFASYDRTVGLAGYLDEYAPEDMALDLRVSGGLFLGGGIVTALAGFVKGKGGDMIKAVGQAALLSAFAYGGLSMLRAGGKMAKDLAPAAK
jgi:hypothetical protein